LKIIVYLVIMFVFIEFHAVFLTIMLYKLA